VPTVRTQQTRFGQFLMELLERKKMTQSDLARAMWGEEKTKTGVAAKGRDRISVYIKGSQVPSRETLQLMAAALQVRVEELTDAVQRAPVDLLGARTMTITDVAGQPGRVLLQINKTVPRKVAAQIMALLVEDDDNG
jgi:transcriptional regulator with XRE-family HTH domain